MKALIVSEKDLGKRHVGVNRVQDYYLWRLRESKHQIFLARVDKSSETKISITSDFKKESEVHADSIPGISFDICIVIAPWLAAQAQQLLQRINARIWIGYVHDLIPNHLSSGHISMGEYPDVIEFANEHHRGYMLYEAMRMKIICNSRSTMNNYTMFYRNSGINICYEYPLLCSTTEKSSASVSPSAHPGKTVLIHNGLDARKGLEKMCQLLAKLSELDRFHAVFTGRRRASDDFIEACFEKLKKSSTSFEEAGFVEDSTLSGLMKASCFMLFPSTHEGLGLPVLEAQLAGLPVITTPIPALMEININETLGRAKTEDEYLGCMSCLLHGVDKNVVRGNKLAEKAISLISSSRKTYF